MKHLSKEEFEKMYCENSDLTIEEYNKYFITLPCDCGVEYCRGWVAENKEDNYKKCRWCDYFNIEKEYCIFHNSDVKKDYVCKNYTKY